jgi:enamine deaminase RidA (YjgF/YER057c/UK114 family)
LCDRLSSIHARAIQDQTMFDKQGPMNRILPLALIVLMFLPGYASARSPKNACFHRDATEEIDIGYCEAVRVGDTLYISGTAGKGEMGAAMRSVYGRLKQTLEANGLTFEDVVKENVYATDLDGFIKNKEIRKEFYGRNLPAATWVQVQRLYVPSLVVEVELTAVYKH